MYIIKKIKAWAKVANPNKGYLAGNYIACICSILISIIQAYPAANVITSLTSLDFTAAIFWLLIGLFCTLLYYISESLDYYFYYKQCDYITTNLSNKLYQKVGKVKSSSLRSHSIEKLMLIFTANLSTVQSFTDYLCYQISDILRAIITCGIVAYYNLYMGLIMLAVVVLLYFWYKFLAKKDNQITTLLYSQRDKLGEKITDMVDGRKISSMLNIENLNKDEYLKQASLIVSNYSKRSRLNILKSNWTYGVLYGVITALTIWLATLTNSGTLTLTVYLVIAPYLIDILNYSNEGYDFLKQLERADVCRLRIQTVLEMPEEDIIEFSNNTTDNLGEDLIFSNVTYKDTQEKPYRSGDLNLTNFCLKQKSITVFKGVADCGKRSIFYMLRRTIKPTTGTITMDGINLYDFSKSIYKHNFSYATSKPYFYSQSIMDNLMYVTPNRKKIISMCKKLDIDKTIKSLKNEYETNLVKQAEDCSAYLLFMIGLARALLSESEWICIYEFPLSLTKTEQDNIKKLLKSLKANYSFIVFTASDTISSIADSMFNVAAGKVTDAKKQGAKHE